MNRQLGEVGVEYMWPDEAMTAAWSIDKGKPRENDPEKIGAKTP